ncbi:hypothetical protein PNOK_0249400 [Pyrrhoderma noxium]|uniref:Uncharacterized protein n=1 Tax=Pyrrhoderma noxium TaxID=2282107 RepID=A0A286USG9_9AGAM|nr:hypothetical protein PNOK_0249400 [Pyrrhoderma noxium]
MSQHENFPQRPTLGEELFAEVVTHRSITSGPGPKRTYDNVSLSAIGEAAVEVAVTSYRYKIESSGLFANTGNLLSDENYRKWVNHYDM